MSDRCSSGKAEDKTGPELRRLLTDSTTDTAKLLHAKILKESTIPDDVETIKVIFIIIFKLQNQVLKLIKRVIQSL